MSEIIRNMKSCSSFYFIDIMMSNPKMMCVYVCTRLEMIPLLPKVMVSKKLSCFPDDAATFPLRLIFVQMNGIGHQQERQ